MDESKRESKLLTDVKSNWKFFVIIFLIGVAYAENKAFLNNFINLSTRVDKKIKLQNDMNSDIIELRIKQAVDDEHERFIEYLIKENTRSINELKNKNK